MAYRFPAFLLSATVVSCAGTAPAVSATPFVIDSVLLIGAPSLKTAGHFVIRSSEELLWFRDTLAATDNWTAVLLQKVNFNREMVVGLAMDASGCGPEPLIAHVTEQNDSVHVGLRAPDFGPCQLVIQWIELVTIPVRRKPVVFEQIDRLPWPYAWLTHTISPPR
jgi:hypothetical protein